MSDIVHEITMTAGPAWERVIPTEPINLPVDLLADARRIHAEVQARNQAHGYKGFDFETWIAEILRDAIYGHGFDAGESADWIER